MVSYLRRLEAESIRITRVDDRMTLKEGETVSVRPVRLRTPGRSTLTGAAANGVPANTDEMRALETSERTGRFIDRDQPGSTGRKKREGRF